MEKLILTLHIIVCVILVLLVLLQSGKEGMGVIFGGGSSSLFGSTGAGGILVKLTTFVAVIFLATSLGYNIVTSSKSGQESTILDIVVDDPSAPRQPTAPGSGNGTSPDAAPAAPAGSAAPADGAAPAVPSADGAPAAPADNAAPAAPTDAAAPTPPASDAAPADKTPPAAEPSTAPAQ